MKPLGRMVLATLFMLLLSATVLWADDDPPGRVARLQYMSGQVSIQPQGTQDWIEGSLNRPLTNADNVWTDKSSRAELNMGTGVFRMDSETSLTITNITDQNVQVELHQGTLSLHIKRMFDGEVYEIDTPNMAFTVQKSGDYRFDVAPEGDASEVTVWKGEGDATGDGPAVRVKAHERARFTDGTSLAHSFSEAPPYDGFDDWGRVRDQRLDKSSEYVASGVIGAEDLDEYGYWRTVPDYGPIWVPSHVVAGWAPYRYGHWVWISPWGWTWVDDAPWGFAPFHYGRWVYYDNYWGWAPGPYYSRPVYAPALVAWFGGPGWGVSLGFGGGPGYGWCPLGFGEAFVPWYHAGPRYFRNVNVSNTRITNITNITNIYQRNGFIPQRNINLHSGATAVSEHTLVSGGNVSHSMVRVSENEFSRSPWDGKSRIAEPTRESRLGSDLRRPSVTPPQQSFSRPVFSKMRTPAANNNASFNRGNGPESGALTQKGGFNGNQGTVRNVPRPGGDNNMRSGALVQKTPGTTENGSFNRPGGERNVPRPPERTNIPGGDRSNAPQRTEGPSNAPRSGAITGSNGEQRGTFSRPVENNNVPRPPANNNNGGGNAPQRTEQPTNAPRSGAIERSAPVQHETAPRSPSNDGGRAPERSNPQQPSFKRPEGGGGRTMNVPRPTGRVLPASNQSVEYRAPQSSRGFSAPSRQTYSGNSNAGYSRSYGAPRSYSSGPSYSSSPRSSAPRYSAPSGRGGYSSAPSYHSAPSSHGGSSSHSYGGGGGHSGHGR